MSHDPNGRIDRETAERLLRGEPVGPSGLACLLAAAGEPVSPGPLPGEQQALAAFHRAEATRAPRPRRRIMIKLALAQMVATKAFAATAAAAAAGGVAAAAATGHLPLTGHHDTVVAGSPAGGEPSHSAPGTGDPTKGSEHSSEPGTPTEHPSSPPETHASGPTSYADLCRSLFSGSGGEVSVKLTWPQFAGLLAKGGGTKDGVVAYCSQLIAPPVKPTEHPTEHPTSPSTEHPTSPSTEHPSPEPTHSESHAPTPTPTHSESHAPTPTPTESHPAAPIQDGPSPTPSQL